MPLRPAPMLARAVTSLSALSGGRVVRLLPNGIGVKFIEQQNLRDLERLIARTAAQAAAEPGLVQRPSLMLA